MSNEPTTPREPAEPMPGHELPPVLRPTHTARDGSVYEVSEPLRPELKPGDTITTVPDRYCDACQEPRSTRRCPIPTCRALTRLNDINPGADVTAELERAAERAAERVPLDLDAGELPEDQGEDFPIEAPYERTPSVMRSSAPPAPTPIRRGFVPPRFTRGADARRDTRTQERNPMQTRRRHVPELDDNDREVHRTGRRRKDPLQVVEDLFADAKVDRALFVQMQCAFVIQGNDPQQATDLAVALYAQLVELEQVTTQRSRAG